MSMSGLLEADHLGNRAGQAIPAGGLVLELPASSAGERIELGAPVVLGRLPLVLDRALVLQLVQRGIERSIGDLKTVARGLPQPQPDGPAVQRLERQNLEQQQVQRALDEIGWSAHDR